MLQQEELAQVAQQVADELRVVGAVVRQALHEQQRLGRAPLDDDVGDLEEQVGVGRAERLEDVGGLRSAPSEYVMSLSSVPIASRKPPCECRAISSSSGVLDRRCAVAAFVVGTALSRPR